MPDPAAVEWKHSDTLYDYIKFHLSLYLATPTALSLIGTSLGVNQQWPFRAGLVAMMATYFVTGLHASWTIAGIINTEWTDDQRWAALGRTAHTRRRRFLHHYMYWIGLLFGLLGLGVSLAR